MPDPEPGSVAGKVRCPRCGRSQPRADRCARCGVGLKVYRSGPSEETLAALQARSVPDAVPPGPLRRAARALARHGLPAARLGVIALAIAATAPIGLSLFYRRTDAYRAAEAFLRDHPTLAAELGSPLSFGWFPTGEMRVSMAGSTARYAIDVQGERGDATYDVALARAGKDWRVTHAARVGQDRAAPSRPLAVRDAWGGLESPGLPGLQGPASRKPPRDQAKELHAEGVRLAAAGREDEALARFREVLALDPRREETCQAAGAILERRGRWDDVIKIWSRLLAITPDVAEAHFRRGGAHFHKGDVAAAVQDARLACDLGHQESCHLAAKYAAPPPGGP